MCQTCRLATEERIKVVLMNVCLVQILLNVYIVHVGLVTDRDCVGSVAIFSNVCYVCMAVCRRVEALLS